MPGAHQRGARRLGARHVGFGDGCVVDDRLPLDERLLPEACRAVVFGRVGRRGPHTHGRRHEMLGTDQFDAEALEHRGSDVDELVGLVEIEFDRAGLVLVREVREARHRRCNDIAQRRDLGDEYRQPMLAAGQIDRRRRPVPDVVGRAPSARIGVVDEFEFDQPRVTGVVGQCQANAAADDRLTGQSEPVPVE